MPSILQRRRYTFRRQRLWTPSKAAFRACWAAGANAIYRIHAMKKNVAGQKIGAQLVSATDGSAFTGSVTVRVTVDAGTQATGTVGSGACTHEGNGYHTYAPSQAETNGDLLAFTFTGSGAIPVTIQVYTIPTTGILAPTVANRTLDVSAGGEAGIDWANVGTPSSTVSLTNTTVATVTTTTTATNVTTVNGLAANVITAASLAADAGTEIGTAVWATTTRALTDKQDFELSSTSRIAIWQEDLTPALVYGANSGGLLLYTAGINCDAAISSLPAAATIANEVWLVPLPGSFTAGEAGYIVGNNLNATITSRMATYTQPTGFLAATFPTTVASTTNITAGTITTVSGNVNGSVGSVTGAVGSVTGNVGGNVVGSVASVTGNVGGNVVGSVASVTGNVGGNVVGSVASVTATVSADVVSISGDATAADNLESYLDGTNFMPVDAHKPVFSISGATLTVKKPDGTTTAYTRTLTTDATADPVTGSS